MPDILSLDRTLELNNIRHHQTSVKQNVETVEGRILMKMVKHVQQRVNHAYIVISKIILRKCAERRNPRKTMSMKWMN